jgi:hydrogenase maturation protein HypF
LDLAPVKEFRAQDRNLLTSQLAKKINTPLTSSMGRLFDAAAALAGVRQRVNYEGQAAIEFEALADKAEAQSYPFPLELAQVGVRAAFQSLIKDVLAKVTISRISAKFHNGLSDLIRVAVNKMSKDTGIRTVAFSGGV